MQRMVFPAVRAPTREPRVSSVLPAIVLRVALRSVDRVAGGLVACGVTAHAVTVSSLVLAAAGAVLVALGRLEWAAVAAVAASIGDALDGAVARRTGSASVPGALLDASVDRYEELLLLGGIAIHLRAAPWAVALTFAALGGAFMVSYGSAKAEALGVPVPPGAMRRAERAVWLCTGLALTPVFAWAARSAVPSWAVEAPLLVALAVIAVVGNASAVRRLRLMALAPRLTSSRPAASAAAGGAIRGRRP